MKTLLLTLLVVTIVCLDLASTMICYSHKTPQPSATITCEEKTCYKKSVRKLPAIVAGRGCGCPSKEMLVAIHCCRSDKCNE
nr:RecName: Full=Toxin F-VIII; AltName: Full=Toxin DaF8; AltName: Full=Toxin TA2; Flags: Precursor [Dendroaspis angusticeps]CAA37485.1 angusticeps-type protein DaF8 [Dendroaspis angusticeps]